MRSLVRKYTLPGLIICVLGLSALWALYALLAFRHFQRLCALPGGFDKRAPVRPCLPALCAGLDAVLVSREIPRGAA